MISDKVSNTIYFSEMIISDDRTKSTFLQIDKVLKDFNIQCKFLPKTKDIWARDYMPIQINDTQYIEYRYDPDYLQHYKKGHRNIKTYPDIVCYAMKLSTVKSDIILDGGNFVKSTDCIILTDKIVKENQFSYTKSELIKELQNTFEVDKVILIPWDKDKEEYLGHSDGVLRFIDDETVLISHYYREDSVLMSRLKTEGIKFEFLDFKVQKQYKDNWAYINFLQTKDLILLPIFGVDEDIQAIEQMENFYPDYKNRIATVDMTEIVKHHGALNCITWTTKE